MYYYSRTEIETYSVNKICSFRVIKEITTILVAVRGDKEPNRNSTMFPVWISLAFNDVMFIHATLIRYQPNVPFCRRVCRHPLRQRRWTWPLLIEEIPSWRTAAKFDVPHLQDFPQYWYFPRWSEGWPKTLSCAIDIVSNWSKIIFKQHTCAAAYMRKNGPRIFVGWFGNALVFVSKLFVKRPL